MKVSRTHLQLNKIHEKIRRKISSLLCNILILHFVVKSNLQHRTLKIFFFYSNPCTQ